MKGKIIGIESQALQTFNISEGLHAIIIPYDTASEALESLDKNIIDGVILDALRSHIYSDGYYAGRIKVVTAPLTDKGIRLITLNKPKYIHFISHFNEGLKETPESKKYEDLLDKWGLINTQIK
jgi:polar amino acid transport system substrate-binding protein